MRTNSTVGPDGAEVWPSPISDREWVDDDGVLWRMRGHVIGQREIRRLLKQPGLRVLHVYDGAREVEGQALTALLEALDTFHRGEASPYADFDVAEFRDERRRVLLLVQESC